jgi:type IV pilus assembly protein PilN
MIKINLLPAENRKTSRKIKLPALSASAAVIPIVIAVIYIGVILAISTLQARNVAELENKIEEAKQESAALAPQLAKIRKLTKEREEVNRRLGVIASLDKDRYFRVQILNDISEMLPENCWLTLVKEQGGMMVSIDGVTFSNYIIADLMNSLEKSDRFGEVLLKVAQEGTIHDHRVIEFSMESTIIPW